MMAKFNIRVSVVESYSFCFEDSNFHVKKANFFFSGYFRIFSIFLSLSPLKKIINKNHRAK
jgi:hypothetical protein